MSDLKQVLSDEIRRLARKEIKLAVQPLQANIVSLRRQVAELKKLLKESNKKNEILQKKAGGENVAELTSEEPKLRLNAAGIIRIRTKLKLSQSDFAKLLDVTMHSVCSWENGKSHPRAAMKTKICSLRKLGKRQVKKVLAEKQDKPAVQEYAVKGGGNHPAAFSIQSSPFVFEEIFPIFHQNGISSLFSKSLLKLVG